MHNASFSVQDSTFYVKDKMNHEIIDTTVQGQKNGERKTPKKVLCIFTFSLLHYLMLFTKGN